MECLKAASCAAGTPSDLLSSLTTLEEQLQEVLPESLPPVLEGKQPWEMLYNMLCA